MTRRNEKRNNRRNRQRNNNSEVSPIAQMFLGALLGKGAEMIASALMDKAEENKKDQPKDEPFTGIRQVGNHVESSLIVKNDGTATEIPVPDGFSIFISEEGKPMIRKKTKSEEVATDIDEEEIPVPEEETKDPDEEEGKPITYDDILKELYYEHNAYWASGYASIHNDIMGLGCYKDAVNCTTPAQAKRLAAFNKLQNIAKFLNKGWKPDFEGYSKKWCIVKDNDNYCSHYNNMINDGSVYFKSEDISNKAIRLMGEESLNDLFSTDW